MVTCRAVAPMTKLSGWTLPLLERGGRLVALKGRSAQEEIEKASKEIAKCGGIRPRVVDAEVGPGLESTHVLMVDKKQVIHHFGELCTLSTTGKSTEKSGGKMLK